MDTSDIHHLVLERAAAVAAKDATFHGPMSLEVRELEVTAEGSVAFCTSLNCLTATPVDQSATATITSA